MLAVLFSSASWVQFHHAFVRREFDRVRAAIHMIDVELVSSGRPSRELLTFERMVRVKPYPIRCPYEGISLFEVEQELRLQPGPTRAEIDALRKLYRRYFPPRPKSLLEVVCDGQSRLPRWNLARRTAQLHLCEESMELAQRQSSTLEHRMLPPLRVSTEASTGQTLYSYDTSYAPCEFNSIVCDGCVEYSEAPVQLIEELYRVLSPGGTLIISFRAPRSKTTTDMAILPTPLCPASPHSSFPTPPPAPYVCSTMPHPA